MVGPWAAAVLATTGAADDSRFAPVLAVQALDHLNHQRIDDAEREARRAVELLAGSDIPFSALPWSVLCSSLMNAGRADEVEGVDAFVEAARATGDDHTLSCALLIVGTQWYVRSDQERCVTATEEAMRPRATDRQSDADRGVGFIPRRRARIHRSTTRPIRTRDRNRVREDCRFRRPRHGGPRLSRADGDRHHEPEVGNGIPPRDRLVP